ncbi:RHS repeat-associated core domain-containing protein [Xenorhabdus cabanillasii JM26]|nr:RHS repeat-associated core domain-containing protein [Xenorhabdus cabanillasii JM26]
MNPYGYVHNPVNFIDPYGLTGCPVAEKPSPALKDNPWHPDSVKARQKEWLELYGPKPSKPTVMQKEVERGQAPREIERVDKGHIPGQEPHVHYKDGTSSNQSGGIHDAHKGVPNPTRKAIEWLRDHGWTPPD